MSAIIGFDITPNSGSSLRKVLRWSLEPYLERLEAVSIAATREHSLELSLHEMKEEWRSIDFVTSDVKYEYESSIDTE